MRVLLGGYLGDWLTMRIGLRRLALRGMGTLGLLLAGALVGGSISIDTPLVAVLLCSTVYFCSYIQLAARWAAMADIGGRQIGALLGVGSADHNVLGAVQFSRAAPFAVESCPFGAGRR